MNEPQGVLYRAMLCAMSKLRMELESSELHLLSLTSWLHPLTRMPKTKTLIHLKNLEKHWDFYLASGFDVLLLFCLFLRLHTTTTITIATMATRASATATPAIVLVLSSRTALL